jgi:protein-disulfide isomerase
VAAAQTDPAALAPRREGDDMVMGAASAPVTIIEYASLTCPHCAAFNANTFPQLKSEYIDRGLVKYVYRDFPLDRMALEAAKIARCAGPEKYFGFVDVLFRQQQSWTRGNDAEQIMANLRRLAKVGGMSDATFDACSKDKTVENAVLEQSLKGERELKVGSTPTLIINGQKYTGALSFEELDKMLKPLVGKS